MVSASGVYSMVNPSSTASTSSFQTSVRSSFFRLKRLYRLALISGNAAPFHAESGLALAIQRPAPSPLGGRECECLVPPGGRAFRREARCPHPLHRPQQIGQRGLHTMDGCRQAHPSSQAASDRFRYPVDGVF